MEHPEPVLRLWNTPHPDPAIVPLRELRADPARVRGKRMPVSEHAVAGATDAAHRVPAR